MKEITITITPWNLSWNQHFILCWSSPFNSNLLLSDFKSYRIYNIYLTPEYMLHWKPSWIGYGLFELIPSEEIFYTINDFVKRIKNDPLNRPMPDNEPYIKYTKMLVIDRIKNDYFYHNEFEKADFSAFTNNKSYHCIPNNKKIKKVQNYLQKYDYRLTIKPIAPIPKKPKVYGISTGKVLSAPYPDNVKKFIKKIRTGKHKGGNPSIIMNKEYAKNLYHSLEKTRLQKRPFTLDSIPDIRKEIFTNNDELLENKIREILLAFSKKINLKIDQDNSHRKKWYFNLGIALGFFENIQFTADNLDSLDNTLTEIKKMRNILKDNNQYLEYTDLNRFINKAYKTHSKNLNSNCNIKSEETKLTRTVIKQEESLLTKYIELKKIDSSQCKKAIALCYKAQHIANTLIYMANMAKDKIKNSKLDSFTYLDLSELLKFNSHIEPDPRRKLQKLSKKKLKSNFRNLSFLTLYNKVEFC